MSRKNSTAFMPVVMLFIVWEMFLSSHANAAPETCLNCHTGLSPVQVQEWKTSAHAKSLETLKASPDAADKCLVCHSSDYRSDPAKITLANAELGNTCTACHKKHDAELRVPGVNQELLKPKKELCNDCHTIGSAKPGEVPQATQVEIFTGKGGIGVLDSAGIHRLIMTDGCVTCHTFKADPKVVSAVGGHTFKANVAKCADANCHGNNAVQRKADANKQIADLLAKVDPLLVAYVNKNSDDFKNAKFNVDLVKISGDGGVHNLKYSKALLEHSISVALLGISVLPPALSAPADGTVFVDTLTPTLKWQASQGAASYGVQIATDDKFTGIVIEGTKITQTEYPTAGKLAPGKYFWRVNATGNTGSGEWSTPWSFTVDAVNILIAPVITVNQIDASFSIQIEKAKNLYGFQFDLQFDPTMLEAVNVTEGDFLKGKGGNTSFLKPSIDNNAGVIKNVVVSRVGPGEVDGAGTLVTLQVRFKQAGPSPIRFTRVKLSNEGFQPIPFAYVDGSITLDTSASARFTIQPRIVDNQVVAKVLIADAVNLRGYTVDVEYPPALELLNVQQGDFLKDGWQQTSPRANTVRLSASKGKEESVKGSGEIATLTFRIWEGGKLPFVLKNGSLTAPVVTNTYTPQLENGAITVVASPNWEVNKDYAVDTQDIVILGINFDKNITGNPRPNPDVTRDKLVDIFDLVAVASHFGDEYSAVPQPPAAPAMVVKRALQSLPAPTPVQHAVLVELYDRVSGYPEADASVLAAKQLLARLIGASEPATPEDTRVSQNYPNPFNPETWIPFELKEAAGVTIDIYNAKGERVRTLALGGKPAGFYLARDRAAYWDGRNVRGEPVASGVYFYTFTAGTYTATRKLIVLK